MLMPDLFVLTGRLRLRLSGLLQRGKMKKPASNHTLAGEFAINVGFALQPSRGLPEGEDFDFDSQLIARNHRPPEPRALNSGKYQQLVVAIADFFEEQNGAGLRHRLNNQDARHDRISGKVPVEERLVDGDILDGDNALGALDLDYAIEQKHGIAMRQQFQNAANI